MQGYCFKNEEEQAAERLKKGFPIDFDNEIEGKDGRKCVDIIPFFLFVGFCLAECYFGYSAFSKGEPNRLLYSVDARGNLCGSPHVSLAFSLLFLPPPTFKEPS